MKYLDETADRLKSPLALPEHQGFPTAVHLFSEDQVTAVNAALAAGRPLLVKGEPGTGKSQLARAAAVALGRHFLAKTLDAHTEAAELFWRVDAVRRLAEAQLWAPVLAARSGKSSGEKEGKVESALEQLMDRLDEQKFLEPGLLWWAFDRESAGHQESLFAPQSTRAESAPWVEDADAPSVILLDEVDKADPILPNALLEALGIGRFPVPGRTDPVQVGTPPPLVVITSNEERTLPDAFVRRCLVLTLELPDGEDLVKLLIERGRAHAHPLCEAEGHAPASEEVLEAAARLLLKERDYFQAKHRARPGQAEYFDLVRVLVSRKTDDPDRLDLLEKVAPFIVKKHGDPRAS